MPVPSAACALVSLLCLNQTPTPVAPAPQPPVVAPPAATPTTPLPPLDPVAEMTPDYPGAIMTPASTSNYKAANRPVNGEITMIVIHDIEGTAISTVHWFQNPKSQVTAHYIIAGDGTIYQAVKEHNIAWHAGNRVVNGDAVGIEHEGYAYRPGYYNAAEYEASAKLVRSISTRYNIPRDRQHIIGHFEVPDLVHIGKFGGAGGHTDPGPWWDWDSYMVMVRSDARLTPVTFPTTLHPGESAAVTVTLTNMGDDPWPSPSGTVGADRASLAANAIAQRAKGLIYLGAWSPATAPLPPASAFFGTGWISPRFVAPVASDIAPGQDATFTINLHAPMAIGPVMEQFRLYQEPIEPRIPVAFGPTVSATIDVQPYDLVVDATTPAGAFSATGWGSKTVSGTTIAYFIGVKPTASAPAALPPAQWTQSLPAAGLWDVYVRWTPGQGRTKNAAYTVSGSAANAPGTIVVVNQQNGGGTWYKLGRYPFSGKAPAVVTLAATAAPGATVVADAVRFVGPFPAPPGAVTAPTAIPVEAGPSPGSLPVGK